MSDKNATAQALSDRIMGNHPGAFLARYEELRQYSARWANLHHGDQSSCSEALKDVRLTPDPWQYALLLDEMAEWFRARQSTAAQAMELADVIQQDGCCAHWKEAVAPPADILQLRSPVTPTNLPASTAEK